MPVLESVFKGIFQGDRRSSRSVFEISEVIKLINLIYESGNHPLFRMSRRRDDRAL